MTVASAFSRIVKGLVKKSIWQTWSPRWIKIKHSGERSFVGDSNVIKKSVSSARQNARKIVRSVKGSARTCAKSVSISVSCNMKLTR